jgi:hypothetical protein
LILLFAGGEAFALLLIRIRTFPPPSLLLQIEILVNSDWPRAVAGSDDFTPRELCCAVIRRLADTVSEFVGDLCGHLEREEEAVVSTSRQ